MNWPRQILSRKKMQSDLSEEIQQHLEEKIDTLVADGMPREEAIHAARRSFGNATLLEQRGREVWMWPLVESIWADIKYAARQIVKAPGIAIVAILTLALGIGANTAVFTLTWAIVLKSLPVPHPGQLVEYEMADGDQMIGLSGPEYSVLRRMQKSCTDLMAWASDNAAMQDGGRVEQVRIQMLSGNAFHVLEMRPYLGNFFSERDDAREGAQGTPVLLSYDFWQRKFHGDAKALGQTLIVADHPVTIIGVMPKAFAGLTANFNPALYLPASFAGKDFRDNPGHFGHFVLGRLKPGMTLTQAQAEVKALEPSVRREADPSGIYMNQVFKTFHLRARAGRSGVSWVKMTYERPLLVLEILVAFLLILCCLNIALVMLARVAGRQREYAVRSALGAGRVRLMRQMLVETVLLTIPGLMGGVLLGWLAAHALTVMLGARGNASSMNVQPNWIILTFNLAVGLLVALGAGFWPALRAARTTPALDLKETDRSVSARHLGGWVVMLQVAVSISLVTAAVLLGGTLTRLLTEHSGFQTQGVAMAAVDLHDLKLSAAQTGQVAGKLLQELKQKPGVKAAAYTGLLPLTGFFAASREFSIDGRGHIHSDPHIFDLQVSSGYFHTVGTRILEGNSTAATATDAMQQCVLGRAAATYFFPGKNAVGRLIYTSTWPQPDGSNLDPKNACRVTGIAEDARTVSLRAPAPRTVYSVDRPEMFTSPVLRVVVRGRPDALALTSLKDAMQQVLPNAVAVRYQTFRQAKDSDLSRERMLMSLSGVFALLALMLTALGLYGLLMRSVALRTREIGIRIALGASRQAIVRMIARKTVIEIGTGLFAGAALAVVMTKAIRQILEGPQASGVWVYLASAGIILFVALVAAVLPARRAASVDPMQALRSE